MMTQFQENFKFSMSILLLVISLFSVWAAPQKSSPAAPIGQDPKCLLPLEVGPCSMKLDRFYYNAKTNTCDQFKFGGCRGNDNKFGFRKTCEDACLKKTIATTSPSQSPAPSGPSPQSVASVPAPKSSPSIPTPQSSSKLSPPSKSPLATPTPQSSTLPKSLPSSSLPSSHSSPSSSLKTSSPK